VDAGIIRRFSTNHQAVKGDIIMKIRSLSNLTHAYVLALSLIAFLTFVGFVSVLILTQPDSAQLANVSGSQRYLSQKVVFLSVELVNTPNSNEQVKARNQLLGTIEKMEGNFQRLVQDSPYMISPVHLSQQMKAMYFNPPTDIQSQISRFTSETRELAAEPANLLTLDNPHLIYLLHNNEILLDSLNQIVSLYQQESEATVRNLLRLVAITCVIILLTLTFLGLYIFRPLANTLLKERVQLEHVNQELNYLSTADGLTGIANRRHFDQFLVQAWSQAARNAEPLALIMCDVDFFKLFNDYYGHLQGDECLKKIATALKASLKRPTDLVARYGGEEFVVVLPHTDVAGALKIAETLRAGIESLEIPHLVSSVIPTVTISLGVAIKSATLDISPITLIENADKALYQAKHDGRNRYILAN